jgi:hypothetical protein
MGVPIHWDNFEVPLRNPPLTDPNTAQRLDAAVETVREIAPRTNIAIPEYFEPTTLRKRAGGRCQQTIPMTKNPAASADRPTSRAAVSVAACCGG